MAGGGVGANAGLNLELEQGGLASVTFVLRPNYETVKDKGFSIDSIDHGKWTGWQPSGGIIRSVPGVTSGGIPPFDYILCCVKSVPDVAPLLADIIRPAVTLGYTVIVLIQNGINIERPILAAFKDNICLSGVSFCGAEEDSPGNILHKDSDRIEIGPFLNPHIQLEVQERAARDFVLLYQASGKVKATLEMDALSARWRKFMFNAVYNPICALTDLDISRIGLIGATEKKGSGIIECLIKPAMEGRAAALASANVNIDATLVGKMIDPGPIASFIMPSMQQDIGKNWYTEVESILGEALHEGLAAGVRMPIIGTLYYLCKLVQFRTKEAQGLFDPAAYLSTYSKI